MNRSYRKSAVFGITFVLTSLAHPIALEAQGSSPYLNPFSPNTSAVDEKGVRHQGSEYRGKTPWLNDVTKAVGPEYPYAERKCHHQGRGTIRLTVDLKSGLVTKTTVLKSTGYVVLDNSAVAAFRQWRWKPGKWREIDLPVRFVMDSSFAPVPRGAVRLPTAVTQGAEHRKSGLDAYEKIIKNTLGPIWYCNVQAANLKSVPFGTVTVNFRIMADGRVENLKVVSNTSSRKWATIAVRSIKEAKFPPIPKGALKGHNWIEIDQMNFKLLP